MLQLLAVTRDRPLIDSLVCDRTIVGPRLRQRKLYNQLVIIPLREGLYLLLTVKGAIFLATSVNKVRLFLRADCSLVRVRFLDPDFLSHQGYHHRDIALSLIVRCFRDPRPAEIGSCAVLLRTRENADGDDG